MKTPILIEPLTPSLHPALLAASAEDRGDYAPLPTHVFLRGGEVVGSAGLCAPVATFWAHSKQLHARESLDLIRRCTAAAAAQHKKFMILCADTSPFRPLMPRLKFRYLGRADFFENE